MVCIAMRVKQKVDSELISRVDSVHLGLKDQRHGYSMMCHMYL